MFPLGEVICLSSLFLFFQFRGFKQETWYSWNTWFSRPGSSTTPAVASPWQLPEWAALFWGGERTQAAGTSRGEKRAVWRQWWRRRRLTHRCRQHLVFGQSALGLLYLQHSLLPTWEAADRQTFGRWPEQRQAASPASLRHILGTNTPALRRPLHTALVLFQTRTSTLLVRDLNTLDLHAHPAILWVSIMCALQQHTALYCFHYDFSDSESLNIFKYVNPC